MKAGENKITPLIEALLETIKSIEDDGQEVSFKTLSERNPHHARRDYFKALEIYHDEQKLIASCRLQMPDNIRKRCENTFLQSWAIISNYFEEQLEKERKSMDESIMEARTVRDSTFNDNELLSEANKNLKNQVLELQCKVDELADENRKLEESKKELEFANRELKSKTELQADALATLQEAISKIKG